MLFFRTKIMNIKVMNNHKVLCGEINSITYVRAGWLVKFSYLLDHQTFYGNSGCTNDTKKQLDLGQNHILIVVDKNNFKNSYILENQIDFDKYNIGNNDTLNIDCKNLNLKR